MGDYIRLMSMLSRHVQRFAPALLSRSFAAEAGTSMLGSGVALQPARSWDKGVEDSFKATTMEELFEGKKVVLFAVPGAYTGVCSTAHVPSYVKVAADLKAKGVDAIACVSVNDPYTMAAWAKDVDPDGCIEFFGDSDCSFTKFVKENLDLNVAALGPGERSNRYSMLVEGGTVKSFFAEEGAADLKVSDGDSMLKAL